MERILGIVSEDTDYAAGISSYMRTREDFPFRVITFGTVESFEDYSRANRTDLLMADERLLKENPDRLTAGSVMCLTEDPGGGPGQNSVFKYKPPEKLLADITRCYGAGKLAEGTDVQDTAGPEKSFISVISPVGGSFASTFSLAVARHLSRTGRTLFISFDPYFLPPGTDRDPQEQTLTDLFTYIDLKKEKSPGELIDLAAKRDGNLYMIVGAGTWFDVFDIAPEHISLLLEGIAGYGFDSVVADISGLGKAAPALLKASDRIFVTTGKDQGAAGKLSEWKRQMQFLGYSAELKRVREVSVPEDELIAGGCPAGELLKGRLGKFVGGLGL